MRRRQLVDALALLRAPAAGRGTSLRAPVLARLLRGARIVQIVIIK
jgi:hypothetical protein